MSPARSASSLLVGLALLPCAVGSSTRAAGPAARPNIVYILADDLGYGDVKCLNPEGKIATPNMDRLAAAGMAFTDAHSGSSVCTPTRYGILTGRYSWRSRLASGVQGGLSPRLIEPGRLTVAELLKRQGYHTTAIGKWHLGMDWPRKPGAAPFGDTIEEGAAGWDVDYTRPIANGPNAVGFDDYFGISASLDMVPYTFIENERVTAPPTVDKQFALMLGRGGGSTRKGPAAAGFEAMDVLPTLTRRAVASIHRRASAARAGQPFFLYLPLNAPHTPIAPTPPWQGKSGLNPYADFVMQVDAALGEVLQALDENRLAQDTLVIFTSDNGCSPQAKFDELLAKGHDPSHVFRGNKADIFEGGHRIPFLVRWPARVQARTRSAQLICLTDLMATCAEIVGAELPDNAGEDSVSILPALLGRTDKPLREAVVHHSINGSFAIRQGSWKLDLCADSGGWSDPRPGSVQARKLPPVQLYDLASDVGEEVNVQDQHPEVVARLTQLLEKYVANGRSTPGTPQQNTGKVDLRGASQAARPSSGRDRGPAWRRHVIDASSRGADGVRLADVNGDGLLDITTGWEEGGVVRVYLHPGADRVRRAWPAVTVGTVGSPEDAVFVDLDGDGAVDVVSCCEGKVRSVFVHWAPRERSRTLDPKAWATEPFPALQDRVQWMFCLPMQVDGKNGIDLVIGGKNQGGTIGWLEAPERPRDLAAWRWHPLREAGWIMSLIAADMDGDGDPNVLASDRKGANRGVFWLENPAPARPANGRWAVHPIGGEDREVMFLDGADLDGDGRSDVVAATRDRGLLVFRRAAAEGRINHVRRGEIPGGRGKVLVPRDSRSGRPGHEDFAPATPDLTPPTLKKGGGDPWQRSAIDLAPRTGSGKGVRVGDIDGDGTPDVVYSCEGAVGAKSGVVWLSRRRDATSPAWQDHEISGPEGTKFDLVQLVDLDGDGDLDVIACEEVEGLGVFWYENPRRP